MRRLQVRRIGLCASIVIGLALMGCHSDQRAATETTREFMEALKNADRPAVKATLTKAAQEKWNDQTESTPPNQDSIADYSLGEAVVTEETALVPVTVKDAKGQEQTVKVKLRKEEDAWRVFALVFTADGSEYTFDFENPAAFIADVMRGMGQNIGSMLKGIGEGIGPMLKGIGEGLGEMIKGINQGLNSGPKP